MASKKCSDLIRQAHSSRVKHVYNALVEIRKKFMKTPKDVAALVGARLVQRLLDLIRSRDSLEEQYRSKVMDISLSILGNMCMEDVTRKQVLKDKRTGVTILVELFEEIELESLQNRACRCLSNMLLDPGSWELVCCASVIEKIVKLLKDTEKEEYKQTCIRAIRLLGQTGPHVQNLVEKNAVSVVSKLIDSDIESIKLSALRCVHSLSIHGCTLQFASQVIASGKIPYLLTLVKDSNMEAFQIVLHLCEHHNFRAEFGNAGGITVFYDLFHSEELFWLNLREDLLSVLCLCCKEAVNRVKLRDENVLIFFIQSLSDDQFEKLHPRIISALVCFLYDETSFNVLLENGLVSLLVKFLKCYIMHKVDASEDEKEVKLESTEKEKQDSSKSERQSTDSSDSNQNILDEIKAEDNETKQITESIQNTPKIENTQQEGEKERNKGDRVTDNTRDKDKPGSEGQGPDSERIRTVTTCEENNGSEDESINGPPDKKASTRPVYSIDSPSYKPNIEWEFEDDQGAKCIERFTPPHTVDYSFHRSYSPLSNSSYYSPGESSPEYSPTSSPNTSPETQRASRNIFPQTSQSGCHGYSSSTGSQSPEYFHPKRSGRNSGMSPFSSDVSSPEGSSEQEINLNESAGVVSPNSFEDLSEDPLTAMGSHEVSVNNPREVDPISVNSSPCLEGNFEVKDKDIEDGNGDPDSRSALNEKPNENIYKSLTKVKEFLIEEKKCVTKRKKFSSNNVTEYNILILLSRVSQMTDPTMHLVTKEVLHCLFDYMSIMEFPLARCPRLLSRVFRNPLCFNKLLTYSVPTMIFDKLLKDEDLNALAKDLHDTRRTIKRKSVYGKAEIHHEISTDSDRFSVSDDSLLGEEQAQKRRRISEDTENPKQSHSFKGQYHKQDEGICNVGKSAMAFLEDLSGIVDSHYGRGAIDRLLHTVPKDQIAELYTNILSVTWTQASRQYLFSQREILDEVLSLLQLYRDDDSAQFVRAVNGFRLLVHAIGTKSKYQTVRRRHSLSDGTEISNALKHTSSDIGSKRSSSTSSDEVFYEEISQRNQGSKSCCVMNSSVAMDTVFVVQNKKIFANRAKLVDKSEIFAAMLEGHYSESQLSEIKIPESSKFAFEYLIHHLHGCKRRQCTCIDELYEQTVDKQSAEQCIALLEESNKYMVPKLWEMANECLVLRYIIPESAFLVLKYAVLHRKDNLLKAAVSCVFYDSSSDVEVIGHLCEILSSCYGDIFLATLKEILIE